MTPAWLASVLGTASLFSTLSAGEQLKLADGSIADVTVLEGVPQWHLYPHLWSHKTLDIKCPPSQDFDVFVAGDETALRQHAQDKITAWCGFEHALGESSDCRVRLSPFGRSLVAVRPRNKSLLSGHRACSVDVSEQPSPWLPAAGLAGMLLFFNASRLSRSMFFRVGSGALSVMLLSVLILLFFVARSLPSKRSMAAAAALFGSSFVSLMKYIFGHWIPSRRQLLHSRLIQGYLALSALVGCAVTYYYDDAANVKLQNLLQAGLMLAGLLLVYCSTSLTEASLAACGLLIAMLPVRALWARRHMRLQARLRDLRSHMPASLGGAASPAVTTAEPAPPPQQQQEHYISRQEPQPAHSFTPGSSAFRRAVQRPLPMSVSPTRQQTQQQTPPPSQQRHSGRASGSRQAISPIVLQGKIFNQATGKVIQIGKATYNKLLAEGYVVDQQQGIITPPYLRRPGHDRGASAAPGSEVPGADYGDVGESDDEVTTSTEQLSPHNRHSQARATPSRSTATVSQTTRPRRAGSHSQQAHSVPD